MSEILDVYDLNGNKLNKTVERDKIIPTRGEYYLFSGVFLTDGYDNFLIQQRSFSKNLFPGKWAITGGSAKSGEDKVKCALREVHEELGIKLNTKDLNFILCFTMQHLLVNIFSAQIDKNTKIIHQPEEVEQVKWVSRQELCDLHKRGDFVQPFIGSILSKIR